MLTRLRQTLFGGSKPEPVEQYQQQPVFLMHIPKTAGTSLIELMIHRFPADACLARVERPSLRTVDVNPFQFVIGHVGFEYLPRFHKPPQVVTFLRHPLDHALSTYYFRRSFNPEQMHQIYSRVGEDPSTGWLNDRIRFCEQANRMDLRQLVVDEPEFARRFFRNRQTQYLAGESDGDASALVARACENLQRCAVVGLTERFEESVQLLCHQLRWQPFVETPRQNVTKQRISVNDLDQPTRTALSKLLEPDLELYDAAQKLFQQRMEAAADDESAKSSTQSVAPLPSADDYTFQQPVFGAGWHRREKCGDLWSSWSGPGAESWLDFRPPHASHRYFQCELLHGVPPQVLDSVQIRINEQLISLDRDVNQGRVVLKGLAGSSVSKNPERLRVHFTVNTRWRPCDLDPCLSDDRWLGINVHRVRIGERLAVSS